VAEGERMSVGPLEQRIEAIIAGLADGQDETLRAIRARSAIVLEALADAAGPEARPTEKWVAVVDFVFQAALESLAIGAEGDRAAPRGRDSLSQLRASARPRDHRRRGGRRAPIHRADASGGSRDRMNRCSKGFETLWRGRPPMQG
jgi:hypothetical protein